MEKFILDYEECDEASSIRIIAVIEAECQDDAAYIILDACDSSKHEHYFNFGQYSLYKSSINNYIYSIFTVEQWLKNNTI